MIQISNNNTKESSKFYKTKTACRCCGSNDLMLTIDLGEMPLANSHKKLPDEYQEKMPLKVMYCNVCSNSQLSVVVNPEIMFLNYNYFSSVSETFKRHCFEMAEDIKKLLKKDNPFCVDIASNDGCLLKEFQKTGFKIAGVEPAKNIAAFANDSGVPTYPYFWNEEVSKKILQDIGNADVITATNVFAHVDDLDSFVRNVKNLLSTDGFFVIEFPYMKNLVHFKEFDTIYHEHLSYFLARPLTFLFKKHGMKIIHLEEFDIHGGTLRVYVAKENSLHEVKESVNKYLLEEEDLGLYKTETYLKLNEDIINIKNEFLGFLRTNGKKIAGYGASAKGNVFVNYCGISSKEISYIVDDTKAKQGMYYSGTDIPIISSEDMEKYLPDQILILAWNFAEEIMGKVNSKHRGIQFITCIPKLNILN